MVFHIYYVQNQSRKTFYKNMRRMDYFHNLKEKKKRAQKLFVDSIKTGGVVCSLAKKARST